MKPYLLFLTVITVFASCDSRPENGIIISGKYSEPMGDEFVKIEMIKNDQLTVVDSFKLETPEFSRTIIVEEPGFYRINFGNKEIANMVLNNVDVQFKEIVDGDGPEKYKIFGSPDTDMIYDLLTIQNEFKAVAEQLNQNFMDARQNGDGQKMVDIQNEFISAKSASDRKLKYKIWTMDNSISGILGLTMLGDLEGEFTFMDSLANKYNEQLPNSSYTIELKNRVEALRLLAVGSPAPEIDLPDPAGNNLALSSLKGKYVLIDFWAAWCRPCRQENPNVVRMYEEFHEKGFEILSVSLDRQKDAWVQAIAEDHMTWNHVSDLNYFDSEAAKTYQISAIPTTYLIGPDGIIIAKNLRGPALEAKLREIFDSAI